MTEIHNPDAPADCKTVRAKCADSGDIEVQLVDDSKASYAYLVIERAGTRVTKIIIEGVVVYELKR